MNIVDITYDFKSAAYLFLCIPIFIILSFLYYQYRNLILAKYTSLKKIDSLLVAPNSIDYLLRTLGFCLAWFLLTLALMQPQGNPRYPPSLDKVDSNKKQLMPHEVIFFVDASSSMSVQDARLNMTRLNGAKDIVEQVINGLAGQSSSLYAFTSDVSKLSPPSMDYLFMQMMLQSLATNDTDMTGTDFKATLKYFKGQYEKEPTLIKSLIILSDGGDNQYEELKRESQETYLKGLSDLIGDPEKMHLKVFTIGLGSKTGGIVPNVEYLGSQVTSKLDDSLLKRITDQKYLKYYSGNDYAAVDVAQDILTNILARDKYRDSSLDSQSLKDRLIYDLYYQYPLTLAILILIFTFFWKKTSVLKCVCILFFFGSNLKADDQVLFKAANFYEADNALASIKMYEEMLKDEISPWERSVITYNLALSYALNNNVAYLTQASDTLQKIPLNQNTSPLLKFRVLNNLAVLNYYLGLASFQSKELKDLPLDRYYKAIFYLKNADNFALKARYARCDLLKTIGDYTCTQDIQLDFISSRSKEEVAKLQEKIREVQLVRSDVKTGVMWLLASINFLEQDVDFLIKNKIKDSLKEQYVKYFTKHALSLQPLWDATSKKTKNSDLYSNGEISFASYLKNMEKNDFETAKNKLVASKEALNNYLKSLFENDSFYLVLSQIENQLSLLSLQDRVDINSLVFLQQALNDINVPEQNENLKLGLDAIRNNIEQSLSKWQNNLNIMGKIYFDEAHAQLNRILLSLQKDALSNPDLILNAAIDEQRHAISQTRYLSQLKNDTNDQNYQTALLFARSSQNYISSYANYFYDAAFARQTLLFNQDLIENVKKERCQYHPWNEVFPVFQKAMNLADEASSDFKSNPLNLNAIMIKQNNVVDIWKEALEKMKEENTIKGGCNATTDFKDSNNLTSSSFENTAQLIQEMNQQDKKINPVKVPLKEGLRPW